jgi:hypothetical protein
MRRIPHSYVWALLSLLAVLSVACSLKVEDLPVNERPVLGSIEIDPEEVVPLDTLRLSISATDPEGDELGFSWNTGSLGTWVDDIANDSIVGWVAPSSLVGVDSVTFTVNVFDYDTQNPVQARRSLPAEERFGELHVTVRDLDGNLLEVDSLAVLGVDTLLADPPSSSFHFESVPWGIQSVLAFQSDTHYGAGEFFEGYPQPDTIFPGEIRETDLRLAPRSLCIIPGVVGEGLGDNYLDTIQGGIDWCESEGADTLYLLQRDYFLVGQTSPQGSAAIILDERDLYIAPYPGEGPLWLNVSADRNEIGFYMTGDISENCIIEGIAILGASDAGVMLDGAGGTFRNCRFEGADKGFHFLGAEGDVLQLEQVEIVNGGYGIYQEGGQVDASACLIADMSWYGIYLKEGGGSLENMTLVNHTLAALYTENAQPFYVDRSIFAGNGKGCFTYWGLPPGLSCNLFWDNEFNLYGVPGNDFIEDDPLFCNPDEGDWRVDALSPALGEACGDMGAFGDCDSPGSPFLEGP